MLEPIKMKSDEWIRQMMRKKNDPLSFYGLPCSIEIDGYHSTGWKNHGYKDVARVALRFAVVESWRPVGFNSANTRENYDHLAFVFGGDDERVFYDISSSQQDAASSAHPHEAAFDIDMAASAQEVIDQMPQYLKKRVAIHLVRNVISAAIQCNGQMLPWLSNVDNINDDGQLIAGEVPTGIWLTSLCVDHTNDNQPWKVNSDRTIWFSIAQLKVIDTIIEHILGIKE
jgi:hypothetical protein